MLLLYQGQGSPTIYQPASINAQGSKSMKGNPGNGSMKRIGQGDKQTSLISIFCDKGPNSKSEGRVKSPTHRGGNIKLHLQNPNVPASLQPRKVELQKRPAAFTPEKSKSKSMKLASPKSVGKQSLFAGKNSRLAKESVNVQQDEKYPQGCFTVKKRDVPSPTISIGKPKYYQNEVTETLTCSSNVVLPPNFRASDHEGSSKTNRNKIFETPIPIPATKTTLARSTVNKTPPSNAHYIGCMITPPPSPADGTIKTPRMSHGSLITPPSSYTCLMKPHQINSTNVNFQTPVNHKTISSVMTPPTSEKILRTLNSSKPQDTLVSPGSRNYIDSVDTQSNLIKTLKTPPTHSISSIITPPNSDIVLKKTETSHHAGSSKTLSFPTTSKLSTPLNSTETYGQQKSPGFPTPRQNLMTAFKTPSSAISSKVMNTFSGKRGNTLQQNQSIPASSFNTPSYSGDAAPKQTDSLVFKTPSNVTYTRLIKTPQACQVGGAPKQNNTSSMTSRTPNGVNSTGLLKTPVPHTLSSGLRTPARTPFSTPFLPSHMKATPPLCPCGRRAKRRMAQNPGPNMGRWFFSCAKGSGNAAVKTGCGFFKWEVAAHTYPSRIKTT